MSKITVSDQFIDIYQNFTKGWYKILMDDGNEFIDYHYVFELDIQRTREEKLKKIGI